MDTNQDLPPGFVAVPSSSRPGQVSYLDTVSNKKYMTTQQCWDVYNERNGIVRGGVGQGVGHFKLGPGTVKGAAVSPTQEQLRSVQKILSDPDVTTSNAKTWMKKYDDKGNNHLTMSELRVLIEDLNKDVGLPPLNDDKLLESLFKKFDTNNNNQLEFSEFLNLYAAILRRVRDRYIKAQIRRDFFIDKNKRGKVDDYYTTKKKLGEGSFGLVYLALDKRCDEERVLKVINKAKSQMPPEELQLEIDTLKALDHPHIIRLFEYFEDYNNVYIIMETARGGELLDVIESNYKSGYRLNEQWIAAVFQQVLEAISYVHSRGIMHKDLKAENIMLLDSGGEGGATSTHPHAVIIDLGLAEMFEAGNRSSNVAGTPITMAPEVWNKSFGPQCDVWSLGVILFQLLSGKLPFLAKSVKKKDWLAVLGKPPNWKRIDHASDNAKDVCKKCLTYDDTVRPKPAELCQSPWFAEAPHLKHAVLSDGQMKDLIKMHERSDLEKMVRMQVASQLSSTKLPKLNAVFKKYDANHNGLLSMDELTAALMELGVDEATSLRAAEALDVDQSGEVEYTEFMAGCLNFFDDHLDNMLWQAFTRFDLDGSGKLSVDEIAELLRRGQEVGLGTLAPDEAQVKAMVAKLDKNADGEIDFDEFRRFFTPNMEHK